MSGTTSHPPVVAPIPNVTVKSGVPIPLSDLLSYVAGTAENYDVVQIFITQSGLPADVVLSGAPIPTTEQEVDPGQEFVIVNDDGGDLAYGGSFAGGTLTYTPSQAGASTSIQILVSYSFGVGTGGPGNQYTSNYYINLPISTKSALTLDQHTLSAAITLVKRQSDVITSSPSSGVLTFNDTDTSAMVSVTTPAPVITASGPSGAPPIALTAAQKATIASAFSVGAPTRSGSSGTINWTYDPSGVGLDFVALNETINITQQIVVTDQNGHSDTADLNVVLNGPHPTPETTDVSTVIDTIKTAMAGVIKLAATLG
jgi:flagellin-like hook-associated protein FlgL